MAKEIYSYRIILHCQKMQGGFFQTISSGDEIGFCLEQFQSPVLIFDSGID